MDDCGEDIVPAYLLSHELRRLLKESFDFCPLLSPKEAGTGGNQRVHKSHAVFAGLASRRFYPPVRFTFVRRDRLDDVEVAGAMGGVDVGIAGVFVLCTLVVSLQSAGAALLLGKPQDCVLGYKNRLPLSKRYSLVIFIILNNNAYVKRVGAM